MEELIGAAGRLDEAARAAQGRAEEARRVALDLARRREAVVHRGDAAAQQHVPGVWHSSAATASRERFAADVRFSLWAAGQSLHETCVALEVEARSLEATASAHRREAAALMADQATRTRSVSSTSPLG
jgi:hypothetical protein